MTDLTAALEGSDLPADAFDDVVQLLADEGVEIAGRRRRGGRPAGTAGLR